MAIIAPFRAIRPISARAAQVAALPYDVLDSDEARAIAKENPYSFLYVDKAEIALEPGIAYSDPRVYECAARALERMIADGTFMQDAQPCLYIYRETLAGRSQTGLAACTSIDDYMNGAIKIHELTRPDKEQDRVKHIDACHAHTGLIFMAHRPQQRIRVLLDAWIHAHAPVYDFQSDDGVQHTVWVIDDAAMMNALIELYGQVNALYIADGHHRSAAAVNIGKARRAQQPDYTGEEGFNYFMSVLFPGDDLAIMDYNRVVKDLGGLSAQEFLQKIAEKFDVMPYSGGQYHPAARHTFGMYFEQQWYMLIARTGTFHDNDPVDSLDVSILQNNLLSPILGIHDPRTDTRIDFVGGIRGLQELERRVQQGMCVAFAFYPTSLDEVMAIADAGKIMPPKSTWFEPKLRSGLFIHQL